MYLPKIEILRGTMGPETTKAVQSYYDGRINHEMVHYNNYVALLGKIKECDAKFEGCSTTQMSSDYNKKATDFLTEINNYYKEKTSILLERDDADNDHDNDPKTIQATKNAFKPFENIADSKIFE